MRISDWSSDVCSSDLSFGPWGIDAHYALGEADNAAGTETKIERFGIGAGYQVAPGWKVTADYELISGENYTNDSGVAVASNDAQAILIAASATAPQPLPVTSRCTSPSLPAAVTADRVASFTEALSCSTQTSVFMRLLPFP